MKRILYPGLILCLFFVSSVYAKVARIEISNRKTISELPDIAKTGPYDVIHGIIHFEIRPDEPANKRIVDLKYAPRNKSGNVEFSTDFELHKPLDPSRGNKRLMCFVSNRGDRGSYFSWLRDRDWLYSEGWSYLYFGWQSDLPENEKLFNLYSPIISDNGKALTGKVLFEFFNYDDNIVYSMPLEAQNSIAYPVASTDKSRASLTVRQYPWDKAVDLPRFGWEFARSEDGKIIPDPTSLYIKEGFKPGWLYDLVYEAKNPKVVGLGLAALRDLASFFRYEKKDVHTGINPLYKHVEHVYAFGHSQAGRLLNHFVYQNFNGDEQGRVALDGILANCPGAGKGEFNSRFAQATRYSSHLEDNPYIIDFFPFTTLEQEDTLTGETGDAYKNARDAGMLPKIIFINSATDYWTRAASLLHTDVKGEKDSEIDPAVRIYSISGIAHTEGRIGIIGRALLVALDNWVSNGTQPPDSVYPRISDNTLVDLNSVKKAFPKIPGMILPSSYYRPMRLDPGPRWRESGIMDIVPPKEGPRYVTLVPQVNADGNEIAGIRLPEIAVPLATYTGWNQRSLDYSNTLKRNAGNSWPFAVKKEERDKSGDPRASILERYPSKEIYIQKVKVHLDALLKARFVLKEDASILLKEAEGLKHWDK